MNIWIALLRGINVSGQKIIRMEELRKVFESLHYKHVTTYVQSGNVVFTAVGTMPEQLRKSIERKILKVFGFEVPVIVKKLSEIEAVIKRNPFAKVRLKGREMIYVTFLAEEPSKATKEELEGVVDPLDEIRISHAEIYLLCRKGYATTRFSNAFIEKKLGTIGTTRNWTTVNTLLDLGKEIF
ncbi:MAG TPA: DUF1697 domain-containing protein [Bacteroidota bacterium]|nr:DUF1697 domain-containing protein [Bacteroidota bacterium]